MVILDLFKHIFFSSFKYIHRRTIVSMYKVLDRNIWGGSVDAQ